MLGTSEDVALFMLTESVGCDTVLCEIQGDAD